MKAPGWIVFFFLTLLGVVAAQQRSKISKPAPPPAAAAAAAPTDSNISPTSGAEGSGSLFRSRNQVNDNKKATPPADASGGSTASTTLAASEGGTSLYRLSAASGQTCTLVRVDALLTFYYRDIVGDDTEVDLYLPPPEKLTETGSCTKEDQSFFGMRWQSYALNWHFAKTPGNDRWYMDKMELRFNSSEKLFKHFPKPGRSVKLTNSSMLFPTQVGRAYRCGEELTVNLEGSKDIKAQILLRDLKIQPFLFKSDDFGPEIVCSPGARPYRDETAPLAVGSTLAVVVLLTVSGYGVYRYFKIKKVQYDTME